MYIQICILFFFLSSFPTESENKSYSITSGTTISTTTQCPQVACTQPLCYAGYTLQYDPEGCHCPCPNLTCSHGTHPLPCVSLVRQINLEMIHVTVLCVMILRGIKLFDMRMKLI